MPTPYGRTQRLVGILNNSVIEGSGGSGDSGSLLLEDTLLKSKWIKITEQNLFCYQYTNNQLNKNYFIQITPNIEETNKEELLNANIYPNIMMDIDNTSTVYNIYADSKPTIDINISVLATKLK